MDSSDPLPEINGPPAQETATPPAMPPAMPHQPPDEPAPPARPHIPWMMYLLLLPSLVLLGLGLGPIVERIRASAAFPFDIDGEEGFVFNQALDLYLGKSIYKPIESPPYVVGNYPPVYPWFVSRMIKPDNIGLPLARVAALSFSLALVHLMVLQVYWRTRRILLALLAPLLFMVSYEFHQWSVFARVDLPALAFTMAGLFLFMNGRSRVTTVIAAAMFVAAGFTKQTAVLAPAACVIAMAMYDRRRLVWFVSAYAGLGIAGFVWLNVVTDGEFARHTILYNVNKMDWGGWRAVMKNEIWFFYHRWLITIAAGGVTLLVARRFARGENSQLWCGPPACANLQVAPLQSDDRPHARGVIPIYALLATLSLISMAKVGSAPNYVLEPLVAWSLLGMETLSGLLDLGGGAREDRRRWARLGALAMTLGLLLHGSSVVMNARPMFSSPNPTTADAELGRELAELALSTDKPILSEFPAPLILANEKVFFQPFIMSQLAREGKWDQSPVVEGIRSQAFGYIITSQDLREAAKGATFNRWTPAMVDKTLLYYELKRTLFSKESGLRRVYYIWAPSGEKKEKMEKLSREALFRITRAEPARG